MIGITEVKLTPTSNPITAILVVRFSDMDKLFLDDQVDIIGFDDDKNMMILKHEITNQCYALPL